MGFISGSVELARDLKEELPTKLGKQFRKIDKLLIEMTKSDDPLVNMRIVEKLLPEAESSTFMGFKNKKNLAKAERLFLSLTKIEDEKMCNDEGYKIISDNSKAIEKAGIRVKRMREIYIYYLFRQEDICIPVCMRMLKKKLATMDFVKLKRLDYVMEKAMNEDYRGKGETKTDRLFALIQMDYVGPSAEKLYETLINVPQDVTDDLELRKKMTPDDLEHLVVERYLIEPCDHISENLTEDIFAPAAMWASVHTPNEKNHQFYYNWARYKFCRTAYRVIGH